MSGCKNILEWAESDGCNWPVRDWVRYVEWRAGDPSKELLDCWFVVHLVNSELAGLSRLGVEITTFTDPPDATAREPFWLHSSSAEPPLVAHCLIAPFQFLQSHTFTIPS